MYKKAYDFKKAQHPFSYFRGTLLQDYVNPYSSKCPSPKLGDWLAKQDKTLWETKLGSYAKEKLKIDEIKIRTKIKDIKSTPDKVINVKAKSFKAPSTFGKITARAMTRVPVIGLAVSGAIEGCQAVNEIKNGEKPVKAINKAALRLTSTTVLTSALGAVGFMLLGPMGSLAGIGIAAGLNYLICKAIDKI